MPAAECQVPALTAPSSALICPAMASRRGRAEWRRASVRRSGGAEMLTAAMGLLLFFVYDLLIDRLAVVYRRRRGKKA